MTGLGGQEEVKNVAQELRRGKGRGEPVGKTRDG